MLTITRAETEAQHQTIRELVAEYIAWDATELRRLGLDPRAAFDFYFASGEEALPGEYASPQGCLLLALWSGVAAKDAGYNLMRLETVAYMDEAMGLYSRFGFRRCPSYYEALESFRTISVFMQLNLVDAT